MCSGFDGSSAIFVGQVVVVEVEGSSRHSELSSEIVQLVVAGVAHQVAPASFTEPPVRTIDKQSQRRRSGRTRIGIGFGRAPSTRTPAPMPTAVATMVTIQEATTSIYWLDLDHAGRRRRKLRRRSVSGRTRIPNRTLRRLVAPVSTEPRSHHPPTRTPTEVERRSDVPRDRSPDRWPPTSIDVRRRLRRRSCSGTRTRAWTTV